MEIGLAYDLRSDFQASAADPEDRFEEYDAESTVAAIAAALVSQGHAVRGLGGGRHFLDAVLERPPELVFNIAEGAGGRSREGHVPGVLEMLGIPYTHSDPLTLGLTLDKAMAKRVVAAAGCPTPGFAVVESPADLAGLDLEFPVLVKPLAEGSSMGIRRMSRAVDRAAVRALVEELRRDYRQPVLVETFCPGPEFTVGVLGTGAAARVLGIMEIVPRLARCEEFVYSLEVKRDFATEVEYRVPPERPAALLDAVTALALCAYRALGCRDVARVDLRTSAAGEPQFLEVNPLPGLNPETSDLVILARALGMTHESLVGAILDAARARLGM